MTDVIVLDTLASWAAVEMTSVINLKATEDRRLSSPETELVSKLVRLRLDILHGNIGRIPAERALKEVLGGLA